MDFLQRGADGFVAAFAQSNCGDVTPNLKLDLGYRYIAPQFRAPGDWGRIGMWWNPSDIQGFYGSVNFQVNSKLGLGVNGGMYEGRDLTVNGGQGLSSDDEVTHYGGFLYQWYVIALLGFLIAAGVVPGSADRLRRAPGWGSRS